MSPRRIIGLTGGIGAGKSTAARMLAELGAHVIDIDQVCRDVIEPGGPAHELLVERFGLGVVGDGGHVDRPALARRVFGDPDALRALTDISHPAANETMAAIVAARPQGTIVVLDMAVLYEYPRLGRWPGGGYDTVVVVEADESVRVQRLVESRGMPEADARARIANQASQEDRRVVADHVLDNSGPESALHRQVIALARTIGLVR